MKKLFLSLLFITYLFPAFAQDLRQINGIDHYNRGNAFLGNAEYRLAIIEYTFTIDFIPDYYWAYFKRAKAYDSLGEHREAINDYTEAIKFFPDYTDAYLNRGIVLFNQGDIEKAIDDWEEALRIEPHNVLAQQDLEMARRLLEQRQPPDSPVSNPVEALKPSPPPRYTITIYNYPNNDGTTQMEWPPNSEIKIIPVFPEKQ